WSPAEESDILHLSYEEFIALHPTAPPRPRHVWRNKRNRIKRPLKKQGHDPEGVLSQAKPDPSLEELEVLFTSLERAEIARRTISPTERTITVSAPDTKPYGVAFMSDIHAGASGVDYARFRADLETIRGTDGLGVIVNGDLFENAKVMSNAGNALYHSAVANPRQQSLYIKTRLPTISDKIIAILAGNHDSRDGSHAGIDRLPDLCRDLDVPYGTEAGM